MWRWSVCGNSEKAPTGLSTWKRKGRVEPRPSNHAVDHRADAAASSRSAPQCRSIDAAHDPVQSAAEVRKSLGPARDQVSFGSKTRRARPCGAFLQLGPPMALTAEAFGGRANASLQESTITAGRYARVALFEPERGYCNHRKTATAANSRGWVSRSFRRICPPTGH